MINIVGVILLVGLLGECSAPSGAGWEPARQRSVGVWQSRLDYRWQLGEWLGPLVILPLLAGAGVIFEIEFVKHMLDRRQDRPSQQPRGLVLLGVDCHQFGQDRLSFAKDVEALIKRPLGLLFSFFYFGKDEAPKCANAVAGIVQNYGKCGSQLLTVRVVRPVFGGEFGEQHREECADGEQ
ncbi:MAG TPA: hypothetical protein VFP27_12340, partial [Mycobacterium sp.]|nr:hypothetical protein [Mycobacterium sp.]